MNDRSCGIRMWAEVSFVLSQSTRLTDWQTERPWQSHSKNRPKLSHFMSILSLISCKFSLCMQKWDVILKMSIVVWVLWNITEFVWLTGKYCILIRHSAHHKVSSCRCSDSWSWSADTTRAVSASPDAQWCTRVGNRSPVCVCHWVGDKTEWNCFGVQV